MGAGNNSLLIGAPQALAVDAAVAAPYPRDMQTPALLRPERDSDLTAIEALVAAAFGPGRLAKAAERVRETNPFDPALSFVAEMDGDVVGTVRLAPVRIGKEAQGVFLGPIAVDPSLQGKGVAKALVEASCEAAAAAGKRVVVLVGEPAVFDSMGFSTTAASAVRLPRPVDQRRVMVRPLVDGGADNLSGPIAAI